MIKFIFLFVVLITAGYLFKFQYRKDSTMKYSDSDIYKNEETLTINLGDTGQTPWNIVDSSTNVVETFGSAVFGNLIDIEINKSNNEKFILSENYFCRDKKCTINLKRNINFHNGREVTAYDVEFSYTRLLLKNKEDNFAYTLMEDIEGTEKLNKPNNIEFNNITYPSGLVSGLRVINSHQIELSLKRDNQFILQKLSTGYLPIVPIEEFDETFLNWKGIPVGFGRYKIIKSDLENYQFILEKTSNEEIPKYIRIIFSDQDIGDLRLLSHMSDSKFDGKVIFPNVYVNGGFLFNFSTKLGADENFRKAITFALDREKIAASSPDNDLVAEDQMLPKYSWQERYRSRESITKQNVTLAKEYLAKVPKELWENKVFNVHSFWTIKKTLEECEYIKEIKKQLLDVGLNFKFHNTDFNYSKFKKIDDNVLWWTGFDTQNDDPNGNFSYFKEGSFFDNIYPSDNKDYLNILNKSINNFSTKPETTRQLSQYFKDKNYMVVVVNVKKRFSYQKSRVDFLESQYNGVRLEVWKIKLLNFKLF